ncbi:MAG: HPr family phosphocarrier protein [Erysipelotrichaceae bacterium]|nr:HPr family phosphocarrier protein [Erysipelotrichaceae bacterium]
MERFRCVVENPMGIHARPAAQIAQLCVGLKSMVTIECNNKTANGNDVLQILRLNARKNDCLNITVDGPNEVEDAKMLKEAICNTDFIDEEEVKVLKIAFFNTKDYDRLFFSELEAEKGPGTYNVDIKYLESRLTEETASLAKGFDAVCIFVNDEAPAQVIDILNEEGVRLILLRCAGFNNVDLQRCAEYGIKVARVPAYSPYAVAEHAMAIIQEANRRLHKADRKVRENNFALSGLLGVDLHNKVCGVMGTGKIGECFARIAKGYGMNVLGWDAYPNKALEQEGLLTYVSKDELLSKADLISLHAPLIMGENGTYHLIDKEAIDKMKDSVMLVNTARGPLIDAEALIAALKEGKFQAVALDVYEGEDENVYMDRSDEALAHSITARLQIFPQLVLTSHQAFFTREAMQAIAVVTMENAKNFNEGKPLGSAEVKAQ